jgi:hypothetical protein
MSRSFFALAISAIAISALAGFANGQCQLNFNSNSNYNVNNGPEAISSGDFNRDGQIDLAVVNKGANNVSILLNQGGRFAAAGTYGMGFAPSSIAAADYNKDGKIDLGVTNQNSNTFTLMRGNGDGSFVSGFTFNTQAQPTSLVFADFNLDGSQDIAVLHLGSEIISIFFGNGTGTFINSLNISHPQFRGGTVIAAADLNLDGRPDIIASGLLNTQSGDFNSVIVALANGAGGFSAFDFLSVTGWVSTIADFKVADLNRDGKPDIISTVSTTFQGDVRYTVARGNGTGAFPVANTTFDTYAFDGMTGSVAVGDFNADGKPDAAFTQGNTNPSNTFVVLNGDGTGAFLAPPMPFGPSGGTTQRSITADFNADGKSDIASTNSTQNKVNLTLNTCGGLSTRPKVDFDGDGKSDLAIYRPSVGEWWYLKSSTGENRAVQFGNSTDRPLSGDFTGDGKTDVAIWRPSTGTWFILRSDDNTYYAYPFGAAGDIPTTGDYDGDGKADAAIFRPSEGVWYINQSGGGISIRQFGQNGDVPIAGN